MKLEMDLFLYVNVNSQKSSRCGINFYLFACGSVHVFDCDCFDVNCL